MPRKLLETGFFVLETEVYLEDDPYLSYAAASEDKQTPEKHGPFKTKKEAHTFINGPLRKKIESEGYEPACERKPVLGFAKGHVEERSDWREIRLSVVEEVLPGQL